MIEQKINELKNILPINKSFDLIGREVKIGNKKAYFVFLDGFAKDEILYYFLERVQNSEIDFKTVDEFVLKHVSYIECDIVKDNNFDKLKEGVLGGMFGLVFEDFDDYILLDTRTYPTRGISESEVEKVIRGSKDSFVETILFNTALIRRRMRSEKLVFEMEQIGNISKTDIAISYIDGLVDNKLLEEVKEKIKSIDTDAVVISAEYIEDLLFDKKWYNPLPLVKYTERPDVCASYLFEGHIVLILDTCPVAIVLPVSIFQFAQHIGDYNAKFINGTIMKFVRIVSILVSTFLMPIFVYLADNTKIFEAISKKGDVPDEILFSYFTQIFILEIAFLLLQASSLNIPTQVAPLIGIIGGLLLSDIGIKLGIVTPISLLAMAITVLTTYSIPSIEFTDATRVLRLFMVICAGVFGIYGLVLSVICIVVMTITTQTLENANRYTYPLIPFNFKDLKNAIIRENAKDLNH